VIAIVGAIDFVPALPASNWAVVTSAIRRLAAARLETAGSSVPAILVSADDVRGGKPPLSVRPISVRPIETGRAREYHSKHHGR